MSAKNAQSGSSSTPALLGVDPVQGGDIVVTEAAQAAAAAKMAAAAAKRVEAAAKLEGARVAAAELTEAARVAAAKLTEVARVEAAELIEAARVAAAKLTEAASDDELAAEAGDLVVDQLRTRYEFMRWQNERAHIARMFTCGSCKHALLHFN